MGALDGLKVLELGGIGPGPFCGMLFADMGADVVTIDRGGWEGSRGFVIPSRFDCCNRNKRSVTLDLKSGQGSAAALSLAQRADVVIDPFRAGVAERLGLGPETCQRLNPRLVYGRITGWGQEGPYASMAGHDLNYIAISGALAAMGPPDRPPAIPLNLVGDFGGGALYLAFGILCALRDAEKSGKGQIVDAAMIDGVAGLMTGLYGFRSMGLWKDDRGSNFIDGGSHFYQVYETRDGKFITIAAIEEKFYRILVDKLELDPAGLPGQFDVGSWPAMKERFTAIFREKTQAEWCLHFEGTDACFAPVVPMSEAPLHAQNAARAAFEELGGVLQPVPAPRLSRTPGTLRHAPPEPGNGNSTVFSDWDAVAP